MKQEYKHALMEACLAVKPIKGNYSGQVQEVDQPDINDQSTPVQMEVFKATTPAAIAKAVATTYQAAYEQFHKEYVANGSPAGMTLTKAHTDAVQLVLKSIPAGNRKAVGSALEQLHREACHKEIFPN
ncbi:hypothetical protein [Pseudomonas kurunegalensis]|uniref:hypothetical protein n=1 Tax=Pseudomonas kurunegalensis TaxID=485880 RepID=UPI00402832AC